MSLRSRVPQQGSNPRYMTTKSAAEIAYRARKLVAAGVSIEDPPEPEHTPSAFHYSTVSSSYGTQISNSDSFVAKAMDPLRTKVRPSQQHPNTEARKDGVEAKSEVQADAAAGTDASLMAQRERQAKAWNYSVQEQHPLYPTTSHSLGNKHPAAHEIAVKRFPMQNKFSSTFNGIYYRDQGLNCHLDHAQFIDKGDNAW